MSDRTKIVGRAFLPANSPKAKPPVRLGPLVRLGLLSPNFQRQQVRYAIYGIMLIDLVLLSLGIANEQWLVSANSVILLAILIIQLRLINLRIYRE
jgi:hypothetical protein